MMVALNTGTFHEDIPKDLAGNYEYRDAMLALADQHESVRRELIERCRADILFYVNSFAWTFRPKAKGHEARVVPFVTWNGQDEIFRTLVDHIDRQVPLVAEKSRDAGWSWACCYTADWLWRFHRFTKTGLFSRIGDLVDSKDPDSLFWKVRFIQKWLPRWLWPEGWTPRIHDTQNYLENPQTGSVITGAATTQDMGVAGRCTWAVFDEFSRVPNAKSVLDNTKDTSDCRVFVSTHTGPGTVFHQLCTNGVTDKIVTHWSEHPVKRRGLYRYHPDRLPPFDIEIIDKSYEFPPDYPFVRDGTPSGGPQPCLRSPWYDQECRERSVADVRTNLDIDVVGSTSQFFNAAEIRQYIRDHARDPDWTGNVVENSAGEPELLEAESGPLKLWIERDLRGEFRRSRYVIGADIGAGTGATPSCASIIDAVRRTKVAQYSNAHVTPDQFAQIVAWLGRMFVDPAGREAKVAWDAGGPTGKKFAQAFMRLGYSHVYYRKMPMGFGGEERTSDTPGWHGNNNEAKATLLMDYAKALEKRAFINPCKTSLEECLQFRWIAGRVEHATEKNPIDESAARESHADHVIGDGLGWMLVDDKGEAAPDPRSADREPPAGSWEWRRRMHEAADAEAESGEGWQD